MRWLDGLWLCIRHLANNATIFGMFPGSHFIHIWWRYCKCSPIIPEGKWCDAGEVVMKLAQWLFFKKIDPKYLQIHQNHLWQTYCGKRAWTVEICLFSFSLEATLLFSVPLGLGSSTQMPLGLQQNLPYLFGNFLCSHSAMLALTPELLRVAHAP